MDKRKMICGECRKNNYNEEWYCKECKIFVVATHEENCNTCGADLSKSNCYCAKQMPKKLEDKVFV